MAADESTVSITEKGTEAGKGENAYSGREMVLLAIEIEKAGHALYRHAEELAKTREAEEIFRTMAWEELGHIHVLNKEIGPRFEVTETTWQNDEAVAGYMMGRLDPKIFPNQAKMREAIKNIRTQDQAIELCIDGEEKSISFYEMMMKKTCASGECIAAIKRILEEEQCHKAKLEGMRKAREI